MTLDRERWTRLWNSISLRPNAERWFDEIARRYDEPQRHYHNAQHINECLREFDEIKRGAPFAKGVELAIWLHDVIYDPRASDNEDKSKEFAISLMGDAWVDELFEQRVGGLIDVTKHRALPHDQAEMVMVDIDLAILGQAEKRFWEYEKQIRAEYAFVPAEIFNSKRAEILEQFLSRERIYHTEHFSKKYETVARRNLAESIRRLREGI